MTTTAEVQGVKYTLAQLRKFENDLYWQTINKMRKAGQRYATAIDNEYPTGPPMSGFDHSGRTGWNTVKRTEVKIGGRKTRSGDWPLVRVKILDPARQIFDMAGRGNLNSALAAHGYGSRSRAAWRVDDRLRREVAGDVITVVRTQSKRLNLKLRRVQ